MKHAEKYKLLRHFDGECINRVKDRWHTSSKNDSTGLFSRLGTLYNDGTGAKFQPVE